MIRIATKETIASDTQAAFGKAIDVQKYIDTGEGFALDTDAGVALFVRSAPAVYKITLSLVRKVTGAKTKQAILDAFDWMFTNTDAQELRGYIAAGNAACLVMVHQTWGYTLTDLEDGGKMYVVTKDLWNSVRPK